MEIVTYRMRVRLNEPIYIAPIGDIQYQGKDGPTAFTALKNHIEKCQKLGAYYLGLGDYIDFASPSNRQRIRSANLYDSAEDVLDKAAIDLVDELYRDYLKPLKGRTIGLLHGHHYFQLRTGETTDQRLCRHLDTTFLGTCAFVRLAMELPGSKRTSYVLWLHHGEGGGMRSAAPLNKLENTLANWDADCFIIGHMSKMAGSAVNRIVPAFHSKGSFLHHRTIHLVGSGGFSAAYQDGAKQGNVPMDGYVGKRMLNPAVIGAPLIKLVLRRACKNKHDDLKLEVNVEI